jgi:hypothetical protein
MDARILRIELRRSVALWAGLVLAAVGIFVLFASNPPYHGWMELAIFQRDIMQLTWPLALGAGAWQGIRERRSRVEELMDTTPLPRRRRVLPLALAMAIGAVAAYLVMLAGSAGHLVRPDSYFSIGAASLIALGALAMVGAVWLGMAVGAMLPSPLTAPLLVVVAFGGLALVPPILRDQARSDPGSVLLLPHLQQPRDGLIALQMLAVPASAWQAVWLVALAATALALFAAASVSMRLLALLPVMLGAAIAVPMLPRHVSDAWVEDSRASEVVCSPGAHSACAARAYAWVLDDVDRPARQALSTLAARLPDAPGRVLVADPGPADDRPRADTIRLDLTPFLDGTLQRTQDDLLWTLLNGAGTTSCPSAADKIGDKSPEAGQRYAAARLAAAAWLLDRDPPSSPRDGPEVGLARQALSALRALPAEEQRARVAALREAELACSTGDNLSLLMDGRR